MPPAGKNTEKSFSWDDALEHVFLGLIREYVTLKGKDQAFKWPDLTADFEMVTKLQCA